MIDQSVSNRPVDLEGSRRIGRIEWLGNTVYDDKTLTDVLGILPGDPYDSVAIEQGLNFNPDEPDVSSLYMDRGYLFFTVNIQKKSSEEGVVDLVMDMYEGDMMRLGEIIIRGNQDVPMEEIMGQIPLKSGEVFNRRELIEAQKAIASMGYFDPEKVGVNPIPYPELGEVSIEFVVKRLITP